METETVDEPITVTPEDIIASQARTIAELERRIAHNTVTVARMRASYNDRISELRQYQDIGRAG